MLWDEKRIIIIDSLCNKDSGVWDISTDSTSLGLTDTQMNTRFAPLAHIFPQNGLFWTIFEVIGQILSVLSRSECSFHGTQNDRQDLTVSTQKSVWKTMHPDPRYIQNCFLTLWAKPNRQPKTDFNQYLGQYWVLLQTDFCVETVRSCRSFWVPWKLHSEQEKNYKISPFTSKMV